MRKFISFYPGPSKVHEKVPRYVLDAYQKGILSINHRSPEFEALFQKTTQLLKKKLQIPEEFNIYFTSSATECWEIVAQSLTEKQSFHLYNGAFGEKWHNYSRKLGVTTSHYQFEAQQTLEVNNLNVPDESGIICLTQNETSNGTQVSNEIIHQLGESYPEKLLAVDATSSLGGIKLNITSADIWFASVQKCLGLPAGMAVLICSPQALEKARSLGDKNHYNSLLYIAKNAEKYQTPYTPNVMNIYLLMRTLKKRPKITNIDREIKRRYKQWVDYFGGLDRFKMFIPNDQVRSRTVIAVEADPTTVSETKERAKSEGFILGNGYGPLKNTTFRIANFPAIKRTEIRKLQDFLIRD